MNNDIGNTLLKHCGEEPMPDQSEQSLAMVPASAAQQIINDALKPCPEIDATTREMADQAEIAYQVLSEALGVTPEQMCYLSLSDLAATAAARLEDQPPPADAVFLAKANRALGEQLEALEEANQALAKRGVYLENENRELRDRLIGREFD